MIRRFGSTARWAVVLSLQLLLVSLASAQATRTWVSGVGDDANPCSRTAPCKTFAGAISKTAAGGEIDALDPGGFGAVTITKSITISGDATMAGIVVAGTNGIVVSAGTNDVVILRNLHLEGTGSGLSGIRFLAGRELHVENCEIRGFAQQAIDVAPSASADVFVLNSEMRKNGGSGIFVHPGPAAHVYAMIDGARMLGNVRGLRIEDGTTVAVHNSTASGNAFNGFVAQATSRTADLTLSDSVSSMNGAVGAYAGALSTVRISNMTISGNDVGLQAADGGVIMSFGNNAVKGNNTFDGAPTLTVGRI